MKISPEDPILTAYALGELAESSRAEVEAALLKDESLAREGAAISAFASFISETLKEEEHTLGEARTEEIFKAGRRPDAAVLVLEYRRKSRRQSIVALLGVAAVVVAGFVGLSRLGTNGPALSGAGEVAGMAVSADDERSSQVSDSSDSTALENSSEAHELRDLNGENLPSSGVGHSQVLPNQVESLDASFVERALSETGGLPERSRFKIGAWVNAGTSISEPRLVVAELAVHAELGPCPWSEKKKLLLLSLRPRDGQEATIKTLLNLNPERVISASLLGSEGRASGVGKSEWDKEWDKDSTAPESGVISEERVFLYELELRPGEAQVGSVDLEVQDEAAGYLPLATSARAAEDLSDDFVMACLFAQFAKWGQSEERHLEALQALASTARELLGRVTDEKARYALDMILLCEEFLKGA